MAKEDMKKSGKKRVRGEGTTSARNVKQGKKTKKAAKGATIGIKTRGSRTSRQQVARITKLILKASVGKTREEAALATGAHPDDIKNLKAGNQPSLKLILRIVREGGFDPNALIQKIEFRQLPRGTSLRNCSAVRIAARIRRLAKADDPAELARATGLSIYTIYQHRVQDKRVGLHTVLAFIDAKVVTPREIFLGGK